MHPSRVSQLGTNDVAATNSIEPPVSAILTPEPQQSPLTRPVAMSLSENAPSTLARFPAAMHPDRIALLSAHNRPSPAVSPIRSLPITFDDSQPLPLPEELLIERSPLLPTFPSGMDVSAPPPNGPIFFDSDQPHTPTTEVHNDRNQTPNQSKAYQKRKAYEVPLLPAPPKTSKIQKFETPGVSRIIHFWIFGSGSGLCYHLILLFFCNCRSFVLS
ncbi:hypothetical protein BJ322DRAFT_437659 [Thelephora terrestris]|uniref:Uncharacterized protein n=1 Tax=Thelephora terrestris TaxID=56493 RepID=A0A9P6HNI5_9AGAM|nr:hypothetical protein BJ322DRAFT_437659 [Thelephora terrestris]